MSSLLVLVLLIGTGANIALAYYSDVITAYFSKIDITTPEAQKARANSEVVSELITDEGIVLLQNHDNMLPMTTNKKSMCLDGVLRRLYTWALVPVQQTRPRL